MSGPAVADPFGSFCSPETPHEPQRFLVRAGFTAFSAVNAAPSMIAAAIVLDSPRIVRSTQHGASRTGVRAGLTVSAGVDAAKEHGIVMVFTGRRLFRHRGGHLFSPKRKSFDFRTTIFLHAHNDGGLGGPSRRGDPAEVHHMNSSQGRSTFERLSVLARKGSEHGALDHLPDPKLTRVR